MLFPLTHTACPVNLEKEEKKWTEASESEENTREDYTTRDTEAETKRQREREGDGDDSKKEQPILKAAANEDTKNEISESANQRSAFAKEMFLFCSFTT